MGKFRDIELKPGAKIRFFDYSKEGEKKRYSTLEIDGETLYFSNAAESQLYHLLDLSIKALQDLSWQERDKLIEEKENARFAGGTPIILRAVDKRIWSVVTEVHVMVKHTEVWNMVEETLKGREIAFAKKDPIRADGGLYAKYLLPKLWQNDSLVAGLIVFNSVSGQGSLKLGAYYEILVCSNGLIAPAYTEIYTHVHKGDKETILALLRSGLEHFLSTFKPVDMSKCIGIKNVATLLEPLPIAKKYKEAVVKSLPEESSYFDIASSLSTVAKSGTAPPNTRIELEELSFRILEGGLACQEKIA